MKNLIVALVIAPLCGVFLCAPAYAQKTKAQLNTEVGTTYPDNTIGSITPAGVRTLQSDVINSIMPTAPVVSGNLACFNGTTGLLQDCGIAPSTLIVGTTLITSGTSGRVLFDNGGTLGEYPITGTGNAVLSQSPAIAAPSISGASIVANSAAPASPASGNIVIWADTSDLRLHDKNSSGTIGTTAVGFSQVAHQFLIGMSGTGVFTAAQPAFTDISGSVAAAQLPTPGASTLGGINSISCVAGGQFVQTIATTGLPTCATPAGGGNVSTTGTPTSGQFALWTNATTVQGVSPASKTDQQTGTSATAAVTPLHQQDHDSALKAHGAWTFSGGTVTALTNNYNVTLVRTSAGIFVASFTTSFASANYDCTVSVSWVNGSFTTSANFAEISPGTRVAGSIGIQSFSLAAANVDPSELHLQCAGRQ